MTQHDELQEKLVDVDVEMKEIELPKIDVKPYIGKKTRIEKVSPKRGVFGLCLKVETEIVDTIVGGKIPIMLRGSRIFGLYEDAEGCVGWGENTKLGVFMKKMGVKQPKELVGKEIILQKTTAKSGSEFLTFD